MVDLNANQSFTDTHFQLVLMNVNLSAVMEERDIFAADILDTSTRDVIIKNACDKRDEAVETKNTAEVDLARQRIELMQVKRRIRRREKLLNYNSPKCRSTHSCWTQCSTRRGWASSWTRWRSTS